MVQKAFGTGSKSLMKKDTIFAVLGTAFAVDRLRRR